MPINSYSRGEQVSNNLPTSGPQPESDVSPSRNDADDAVESPMDAALLGCVAARNDRLTEKQINLLKVSGKDIVMVPDFKAGEYSEFLRQAEDNGWFIANPKWTGKDNPAILKTTDIGRSIVKDGLLFTIQLMMQGTTRNYTRAKVELAKAIK